MDSGGVVDRLVDDPDAAIFLISSWKTFKGIPRVPDKYTSSMEPLLLLPLQPPLLLLSSWYSFISLSLDEETTISAIYKKALKKKTLDKELNNT